MNTNSIQIKICDSIEDAPNYNKLGGYQAVSLKELIIVKKGTVGGNDTIDLIFEDEEGNKFVSMITAKLLKNAVKLSNNNKKDLHKGEN